MYFKPHSFMKTVSSTSVAERITTSDIKVSSVTMSAEGSNTGAVYIGDSQVSATVYGVDLGAGDEVTFTAQELGMASGYISLKDIWMLPSVSGDGVAVIYLERAE